MPKMNAQKHHDAVVDCLKRRAKIQRQIRPYIDALEAIENELETVLALHESRPAKRKMLAFYFKTIE